MKVSLIPAIVLVLSCLTLPGCHRSEAEQLQEEHREEHHEEQHKILVTSPVVKDVISTQQYVCQIHSRRHIEVCALEGGYLEEIPVKEGQRVKEGDLLFKILPTLYQARLDSEMAEAQLAQIELNNTQKLFEQNVVSQQEVALTKAKLAKAHAKVDLTRAELNFASIKAPFDGIIDRLHSQQGSLIAEGDVLTTLSDNDVMWVYFNVPEARYLEYKADLDKRQHQDSDDDRDDDDDDDDDDDEVEERHERHKQSQHEKDQDEHDDDPHEDDLQIELKLANGELFPQTGKINAIEADFNNETGNIAFRSDFANPKGLLRHGQTGTILIHRELKDALVIPQRATYEILAKRYAYVVGEDNVVHQREIVIQSEQDDIYVIKEGLKAGEKIVLEGIRQVRDGDKVEYEFRDAKDVLGNLKYKAE